MYFSRFDGLWSPLFQIACQQNVTLIKRMDNSYLKGSWSFGVIPQISLSSWLTMRWNQQHCRWWLQSQHWNDGSDISHPCWHSGLPSAKPLSLQHSSMENVCWLIWFWVRLPSFRLPTIVVNHNVGLIYQKACVCQLSPDGYITNGSCPFCLSVSDYTVASCPAPFRRTWIFIHLVLVSFLAWWTSTCITSQLLWIIGSCNWWDFLSRWLFTLDFTEFDNFKSWKVLFCIWNRFSASSSAIRDSFDWFWWWTGKENWHNAPTDSRTDSLEAVSASGVLSALEQSGFGARFTTSVPSMPQISFLRHELLSTWYNGLEKYRRPDYCGTEESSLPHWLLTFWAFWYWSF